MNSIAATKSKLKRLGDQIERVLYEFPIDYCVSDVLIDDVQRINAGGNDLAHKLGLSKVRGLHFASTAKQGQPLGKTEAIRQIMGESQDGESFAEALRALADEVQKNASDEGAGVLN